MKRRDFLKVANSGALALILNGLPVRTIAGNPLLNLLRNQTVSNGKVMVFIQLTGGNDGLNTIIPLDQYSALSNARANILIPENKVLGLAGNLSTGMHPSMTGVRNMYNNGLVNIVQGVSYPNQNFSHFRASDIWLTASDSTQFLNDGWLGRYLYQEHSTYPQGYPNAQTRDPLAIEIGATVSTSLIGPNVNMGMAISDIDSFYNVVNNQVGATPDTPAGHELTFLRYIAQQTQQYTSVLQTAAGKAKNLSAQYPDPNSLADQLKIVARLIAGGLQTPVYLVNLGNFDSHIGQVDASDTTKGSHAILLSKLSDAVAAFFDDCKLLGIDNKVCAMTFSEFGRRIISNGGLGTDHGTSEPIMVFGNGVNAGFIGHNPVIPQKATTQDNLDMQYDFRSVYAAVLSDWFEVPADVMNNILLQSFEVLPIFKKSIKATTWTGNNILSNYPNPFTERTTIRFISNGGLVIILLYDGEGRQVRAITHEVYAQGKYELLMQKDGLPCGNYIAKLYNGSYQGMAKMTIAS
jgi:uncharacterized protein (DUF1501 family)